MGRKLTQETKNKISKALKGIPHSDERRKKESLGHINSPRVINSLQYLLTKNGKKKCRSCNEIKKSINFVKDKDTKDGLNLYCRECDNKRRKLYYK